MVDLLLRRLSVRRRIVGGFLVLVLLVASTLPLIVTDHSFIVGRLQDVTNVVSRADRLLLLASTRVMSSRVNLLRYLQDYLPSVAFALEDAKQADGFLMEAKKLVSSSNQMASVTLVLQMLEDYARLVLDVQEARLKEGTREGSRKAFLALKSGNDIGQMIEQIVERSEAHMASTNEAVFSTARKRLLTIVVGYAGVLFFSLILASLVSRSITRPVTELRRGAEAIREGHMGNEIPVAGNDELSLLAGTFNQMVRNLEATTVSRDMLIQEITERKKIESELQTARDYLENVLENSPDAIGIVDKHGRFIKLNRMASEIYGYEFDELDDTTAFDLYPDKDELEKILQELRQQGSVNRYEIAMNIKDGSIIPFEISISLLRDADDKTIGSVCVARDLSEIKRTLNALKTTNETLEHEITERRRFEEALRESEERYRTLFEDSLDAIYTTTLEGRFIEANQAMLDMFGYSREEMATLNSAQLFDDPEDQKTVLRSIKEEGFVKNFEGTGRRKDGTKICCQLSASYLRAHHGVIGGYQGYIRDVSERKRMIEELEQAKQVAEAASHAKTEFLASMSHEIRTPMNAIIGMADLLRETPLTPEQHQYVQVFSSAGDNLLNIINDILDISKVEAGHLDLEEVEFDLKEIAENTCDVLALRAHERGLELACHVMPDVPTQLVGDPVRLRQILMNLVGNAIKFTEKGEVVVEIKDKSSGIQERGTGDVELLFSVADTGIGIPPGKVDAIFESFAQADTSTTREHGGTGLGLTISRRLVDLMGGHIWVESQVGEGSTFYFTAMFQLQAEPARPIQQAAVDIKGMKVLVVDDNATNRAILREMLSRWGAFVTEAGDGELGLAELKHAMNTGDPYQLALIDSRMPVMDGFELAERIRKELVTVDITVMMLTSDRRSGDIEKCRELKIARYLVKPVKQSDLLDAITTAVSKTKIVAEEPGLTRPAAMEDLLALHILLVEDSSDNQLLIQSYLKKTPYQLDIAENGEVAVEKFKSGEYDLVLMDIQMPVMDGYTAIREIRKWEGEEGLAATPIVALTAYATKEEEQKSLDAGCSAHLTKPIKKANLLEAIRIHSQKS